MRRMSYCNARKPDRTGGCVQARVSHGVLQDIVALTEIDRVGPVRARLLFASGLRTPEAIAAAHVAAIETALAKGARTLAPHSS